MVDIVRTVRAGTDSSGDPETLSFGSGTGTGWNPLVQNTSPGFSVYWGTSSVANPSVQLQSSNNDLWTGQIFGFNVGTTAVGGQVGGPSTTGTIASVGGLTALPATTVYALVGGSTSGTKSATNWVAPTNCTGYSDLNQTPDIFLALYDAAGTSVPAISNLAYGVSSGTGQAIQVGIS